MNTVLNDSSRQERLIRDLTADLTPVRRLASPAVRALGWLSVVGAAAVALAAFADLSTLWHRLAGATDMWAAVVGSAATAVLAAIAAFELSMPDARRTWALLPLPAALLWIVASGLGCLRTWLAPETHVADLGEARDCLLFIIALSMPLSALLILMLRRACSLQPGLTAAIGGLAVAAAAATLLNFFHPFDAAATDLAVHTGAVALVIAANRALSGQLLARNFTKQ